MNTTTISKKEIRESFISTFSLSENLSSLLLGKVSIEEGLKTLTNVEKKFIRFFGPQKLVNQIKTHIQEGIKNSENNEKADRFYYQAIMLFDIQKQEGFIICKEYLEKLLEIAKDSSDYAYIYYELNEISMKLFSKTNGIKTFKKIYDDLNLRLLNEILKLNNIDTVQQLPEHSTKFNRNLIVISNIMAQYKSRRPNRPTIENNNIDNKILTLVKSGNIKELQEFLDKYWDELSSEKDHITINTASDLITLLNKNP